MVSCVAMNSGGKHYTAVYTELQSSTLAFGWFDARYSVACTLYKYHTPHTSTTHTNTHIHKHTQRWTYIECIQALTRLRWSKKNIQNGGYVYFRIRTTVDSVISLFSTKYTKLIWGALLLLLLSVFLLFHYKSCVIISIFSNSIAIDFYSKNKSNKKVSITFVEQSIFYARKTFTFNTHGLLQCNKKPPKIHRFCINFNGFQIKFWIFFEYSIKFCVEERTPTQHQGLFKVDKFHTFFVLFCDT